MGFVRGPQWGDACGAGFGPRHTGGMHASLPLPFGGCGTFGTFDYIGVSLTGVTLWTRVTTLATGLGTG